MNWVWGSPRRCFQPARSDGRIDSVLCLEAQGQHCWNVNQDFESIELKNASTIRAFIRMNFLKDESNTFVSRIVRRAKWASLGVYQPGRVPITSIRVAGKRVTLSYPDTEIGAHSWELRCILFDDCYRLAASDKPVQMVLDIGANIGLFALAARRHFPSANIHCYEPNQVVMTHLRSHCATIGAHVHESAVGETEGRASLSNPGDSLHGVTKNDAAGSVRIESFASVVGALGSIDLLKLDCEGAEWGLFRCREPWHNIRAVTMEYHLWAKPDSTIDDVRRELSSVGFSNVELQPSEDGPWGFAWAKR
jgi:FkbM family methyltransferase